MALITSDCAPPPNNNMDYPRSKMALITSDFPPNNNNMAFPRAKTALITSDCVQYANPRIKWP